jgi:indolepyruvate ferredoxin oxidoreductase beta subunit
MNIVIVAVGGQGALFAARVIGFAAIQEKYDVKVSEVHGMSQRGGCVITHVRYGSQIASPIVEEGYADVVIAMEKLEGARATRFLKPEGVMVLNEQEIKPMPVASGAMSYPKDIESAIRKTGVQLYSFDAFAMAQEAGSSKAVNSVMLGAVAHFTGIDRDAWCRAIDSLAPEKFRKVNLTAFDKGYFEIEEKLK